MICWWMVLRKPHEEHVAKAYEIKIKEHIENKLGTYGEQNPQKTLIFKG